MEMRQLGRSSLRIAPLVFGGNVFKWTVDQPTSFRLLDAFLDEGLNCIDTADAYSCWVPGNGGGESETVIGEWMAQGGGRRERVVIATKVGNWPAMPGLKRGNIIKAVEGSLKRLRTDTIDIYQSHIDDVQTSVQEPLEAYQSLIAEGKVRVIGASNFEPNRFTAALNLAEEKGLPRYETMQPPYNLYARFPYEQGLSEICEKRDVTVLAYFSLASGFLTGKYRTPKDTEGKARGGFLGQYFTPRGMSILAALDDVAAVHRATPAQVALAWLMARPNVIPIASATSVAQLKDLSAAVRLKLSAGDMAKLNEISDPVKNAA